jgi:hypothetical protein
MPLLIARLSFVALVIALSGCVANAPYRPLTKDIALPIQLNGLTVMPPQGTGWHIQQTDDMVGFAKTLSLGPSRDPSIAEPQTFIIRVLVEKVNSGEIATADGLRLSVERFVRPDLQRHQRLLDRKMISYVEQGTDCVRYDAGFEEQPRKFILLMTGAGIVCRHPLSPKHVVHGTYSERHARDSETKTFDAELQQAETLLKNIRFTERK